ncbi:MULTISPECIES: LysR family transcriptional regulator [unclassified Haematobacter]|uniref:LysR family transcriptional regulator n=1 Tax=unclassified Haematobacter TaxID=2640585 RepID=UPI0025BA2074|nr:MULTISPECIES: LysR family transcriptional regulator [unclassified Haematobacter]
MDLDGLPFRAFLSVARHKSFTRAAQEMNVSQPALSATIRELERRLGFSLFDRTSRSVELTREGRSFLVNAKRVVLEHDWAVQRARELRSNDLRLAVQPYSSLIAERVALTDSYMAAFPKIDLQITQISSERIYDAVLKDDADIGIVLETAHRLELSPANQARGTEMEVRPVVSRRMGLFLPPGHPLASHAEIPEAALRGQAVAVTGRVHGGPLASAITRYLEELDAEPVRVPEADFFSTLRHARHRGLAAVDTGWFQPLPQDADFLRRPIGGDALATEIVLVRAAREQRLSADHFWNSVKD